MGVPVVKPALTESSHCIGVRELSRGFSLDDPEGCFRRLPFSKQTLVSYWETGIHRIFHGVIVRIHPMPISLTPCRYKASPTWQMNTGCQHGCPFIAEILYIDKASLRARGWSWLFKRGPDQPSCFRHFLAPSMEKRRLIPSKSKGLRVHFCPASVHLEMMEIKSHR